MKIQNTPNLLLSNSKQNTPTNDSKNLTFKGGEFITTGLNFVQTNQAVGATLVDAAFMCTPRTAVDFTRSPEAGVETARREFTSNINDGALGAYGVGAAYLLAKGFNKEYGIKANQMFIDEDSLEILKHARNQSGNIINNRENLGKFLSSILDHTSGFNPNQKESADANGWVKFVTDKNDKNKQNFIDRLVKEFITDSSVEKSKDEVKATKSYLKALLVNGTSAEGKIKLTSPFIDRTAEVCADDFVDNIYKVTKAFMNEKIAGSESVSETFIKGLKKLHRNTAIAGLSICIGIGVGTQPLNMYLTKKKTGKSGFVGVDGREPDKSDSFKLLKAGVGALALFGSLASITNSWKISPSVILEKVKFKGFVPTINQFKLAYGLTIVSRLLSARDNNELREASIKDSLGFANWLILGGFASNLAAIGFEKLSKFKNNDVKFFKYNENENGIKLPKWITGSIVSREEVLHEALKKAGISAIKEDGTALTLKEMLKKIPEIAKNNPQAAKIVKSRIKYLGFIQIIGYLWSGPALGIGIPKLNIAITNAVEKKNKAAKKDSTADVKSTEKQPRPSKAEQNNTKKLA